MIWLIAPLHSAKACVTQRPIHMLPKTSYSKVHASTPRLYIHSSGEKQVKPYNLMCRLWSNLIYVQAHSAAGSRSPPDVRTYPSGGMRFLPPGVETSVQNLSYKRLVGKLGESASLGATLTAERRETWGMVTGSVYRALSAARNIKKLKFAAAARDLGIPYHERTVVKRYRYRNHRGKWRMGSVQRTEISWRDSNWHLKNLGSGWLMYSYGVAPLMGDIHAGMTILTDEFPWKRIHGFAKDGGSVFAQNTPLHVEKYTTEFSYRQSVSIRAKNPNLHLAARLGLVNPLQWALEAIPLSFIADWFSNLSDIVSSLTDFVGYDLENPCVNYLREQTRQGTHMYPDWWGTDTNIFTTVWKSRHRELSLFLPTFQIAYERFRWQRGANAISLLLQVLPTGKR